VDDLFGTHTLYWRLSDELALHRQRWFAELTNRKLRAPPTAVSPP